MQWAFLGPIVVYGENMTQFSPILDKLIKRLQILPGVGPKSAQRIAFYLLERSPDGALDLADTLRLAVEQIGHCQVCRNLTENPLCSICENPERAQSQQICVVESPADVLAFEQTGSYQGSYFVLMGKLSPLDGIGPAQIGLEKLEERLKNEVPQEIILALSPTVEGDATAYHIAQIAEQYPCTVTRIAHGVPVGGSLEWVDGLTLNHSLQGRQPFKIA